MMKIILKRWMPVAADHLCIYLYVNITLR